MAAQVSFGSQLQYEPQVRFAQYAPAAIMPVSSGKAMQMVLYVTRSRVSADGSRPSRSVRRHNSIRYNKEAKIPVTMPPSKNGLAARLVGKSPSWLGDGYFCFLVVPD